MTHSYRTRVRLELESRLAAFALIVMGLGAGVLVYAAPDEPTRRTAVTARPAESPAVDQGVRSLGRIGRG